jgi:hypothetical protein
MPETIILEKNKDIWMTTPRDNWLMVHGDPTPVPGAGGYSARVFDCSGKSLETYKKKLVIKIARWEKEVTRSYIQQVFSEEIHIMEILQEFNYDWVTPMLEVGYIKLDNPPKTSRIVGISKEKSKPWMGDASNLTGIADKYSLEELPQFYEEMEGRLIEGWLPYMLLESRDGNNLYTHCDEKLAGKKHKEFSVISALKVGVQISEIIQTIHEHNIVYRDFKPLHFYWNPELEKCHVIDWNGALRVNGEIEGYIAKDIMEFSVRTFYHMMTGYRHPDAKAVKPLNVNEFDEATMVYPPKFNDYAKYRLKSFVDRALIKSLLTQKYINMSDITTKINDFLKEKIIREEK